MENCNIFTLKKRWNESVKLYGDRDFLLYISRELERQSFTYSEFDSHVKKTANYFKNIGITPSDRIAIQLPNSPEYLICFLAVAMLGSVLVPINEHFHKDECSYILEKSEAKLVISDDKRKENFEGFNLLLIDEIKNEAKELPESLDFDVAKKPEDIAVILFTSGTTNAPKGVLYTNYNVVYGGYFHMNQINMTCEDSFLSSMPCYHMDFQEMALMPTICAGAKLIMLERFSASNFWKLVCETGANFTDTMSIMNRTMLMQPLYPWERNHKIKEIYFSMGLSTDDKDAFEKRFNVSLLNTYGMTETITAVTCVPRKGDKNWPSVGKAEPPYLAKIVDDDGNEVPPGQIGELCIKGVPGKTLCLGYLNDEEASKKLLDKDGWLHSNDYAYMDKEGWVFFVDRKSGLIKRAGENISSLEVECVLQSHPKIKDAVVKGVSDNLRDEAVKAFIELMPGAVLSMEEIIEYCKERLAYFKIPTEIVFVREFQRTAVGKVKKAELT